MSVEIRLYAGYVSASIFNRESIRWLSPLAVLSPPAWGYESALYALKPEPGDPEVFFCVSPDTEVTKDPYGTVLRGISLDRVIEAMEHDLTEMGWPGDHWALDCLRGLREFGKEVPRWDIRVVLYYH